MLPPRTDTYPLDIQALGSSARDNRSSLSDLDRQNGNVIEWRYFFLAISASVWFDNLVVEFVHYLSLGCIMF